VETKDLFRFEDFYTRKSILILWLEHCGQDNLGERSATSEPHTPMLCDPTTEGRRVQGGKRPKGAQSRELTTVLPDFIYLLPA